MTVYINDTEVVMDAGELPGFSYSLWSLTEPDKVKGSRSTTFKLPATQAVVRALGPWHMGYVADTEFPTLKVTNGTSVLYEGRVIVAKRSPDMYELVAVGGNGGWVDAAKRTRLNELDMGETQVITKSYIISRWEDTDANLDAADAYPLIDYGSFAGRASSYDVPFSKVLPHPRVHRVLKTFFNDNGYTVEAKGTFADLWKRIIIAPGTGRIQVTDTYLTGNTATVETTAQTLSGGYNTLVVAGTVSDPGSNISGNAYVAPYAQDMSWDITVDIDAQWSVSGSALRFIIVQPYNTTTSQPMGPPRQYTAGGARPGSWTLTRQIVDTFTIDAFNTTSPSDNIVVRVFISAAGLTLGEVNSATVTHRPTNIEYQANIAVQIGPLLPKLKVADLIKALVNIQNLVMITDDREHRVELWRLDDYLKTRAEGLDWSNRIHFTDGFARIQDEIPSRVEFRFEEDDKDYPAGEYRQANDLGLGDANVDIPAGWAEPYEVEVKFASTQVRETFDGLTIPTIWSEDVAYQVDEYEHVPRLLITDGLAPGAWTFSGDSASSREEYPLTYFAGQRGTLSFANIGSITGTAGTHWKERLRWMQEGRVLQADVMLWDHETASGILDLGKPVYLQWGDGGGWFYVTEIEQKRYGVHEPTRCTFIPLT